eukprot:COSAG06_NODE_2466_length_6820_cov_19.323613_3_plen_98_part_00
MRSKGGEEEGSCREENAESYWHVGRDYRSDATGNSQGEVHRERARNDIREGACLLAGRSEAAAAVSGSGAPRVSTLGTPERQREAEQEGRVGSAQKH